MPFGAKFRRFGLIARDLGLIVSRSNSLKENEKPLHIADSLKRLSNFNEPFTILEISHGFCSSII